MLSLVFLFFCFFLSLMIIINFSSGGTPLIPKDQGLEIRQRVLHFRTLLDQLPVNHITAGSIYHTDLVRNPKIPYITPFRQLLRGL